jgi:hypothetical protein
MLVYYPKSYRTTIGPQFITMDTIPEEFFVEGLVELIDTGGQLTP